MTANLRINQFAQKEKLLELNGLKTYFYTEDGIARAVDDVSLFLHRGETLGIVGESGCGKSVTALSIMRLIPDPPGRVVAGQIILSGWGDLTETPEVDMLRIRGKEIAMIFQEPMTSLNPVFSIGEQIAETMRYHDKLSRKDANEKAVEMLKLVGISSPEKRIRDYPHQLSGGMRQRAMVAMALSCNPRLLLADEPTTALDVTIQAQILELMDRLKERIGTSIILITHDLGVIAEMSQTVCVMYAGVVFEYTDVLSFFAQPLHPYSSGLLSSIPRLHLGAKREHRLHTIPGIVPSLLNLPRGCRFSDRCQYVHALCKNMEPPLIQVKEHSDKLHLVRCWLYTTP